MTSVFPAGTVHICISNFLTKETLPLLRRLGHSESKLHKVLLEWSGIANKALYIVQRDWVRWLSPSVCIPLYILWGTPNQCKFYFPWNQFICRFCDNLMPYKRWPKILTVGRALQKSSLWPQAPFHGCWGQSGINCTAQHPTWVARCWAKAGSHGPCHPACPAPLAPVLPTGHPVQPGDRLRSHPVANADL